MRILQIIDSLEVGGAERMAVNYANALSGRIAFSGLAATRKEGSLKAVLNDNVDYLFVNKKRTFDIAAIFRLRAFCKKHAVGFVHAHGSSFFSAFLLKCSLPEIKVIWHDHNGERDMQPQSQNKALRFCSRFFRGIVVVNHKLEQWVKSELHCKNVLFLPNFTAFHTDLEPSTTLYGTAGKRILCLANLRHPKNHKLVLEAAVLLKKSYPEWTFHFVGNDLHDDYSKALKAAIDANGLAETVYIYGLKTDTQHIIAQADICLLASSYEGLPVAILEYGMAGKAVVSTAVGQIPQIIRNGESGLVVPSGDAAAFAEALSALMDNPDLGIKMGKALHQAILESHSEESVISNYLEWLKHHNT